MLRLPPLLLVALAAGTSFAQSAPPATKAADATNAPPQIIVSYPPAALVRIDGAPRTVPVPGHPQVLRVENTGALILFAEKPGTDYVGDRRKDEAFYLHVQDGWMSARGLAGPWLPADVLPFLRRQLDRIAADIATQGPVRPVAVTLEPGRPAPRIFVSESPAELVLFTGPPQYVPVDGTTLLRAANADREVLMDAGTRALYVRAAGHWLTAPRLDGPWSIVGAGALPPDIAKRTPRP